MEYIVESVSYDWSDPFALPIFSAEVRLLPKTRKDCTDLEKALCSKNYEDVSRLGLIFDSRPTLPSIKNVYFNDPVTVVLWDDGTKTIVRCQKGDTYSKEVGLSLCISKKALGNKGNYNEIFKKWVPEEKPVYRNIDEWIKSKNGHAENLYRYSKKICAPKKEGEIKEEPIFRSCSTCKFLDNPVCSGPCCDCDMSYSAWVPRK